MDAKQKSLRQQIAEAHDQLRARFEAWESTLKHNQEWTKFASPWGGRQPKPLEILRAFAQSVAMGYYPPPEVLLSVAAGIGAYVDGEKDSLDSALNVRPIQKAGTPVNQERRRLDLADRLWDIAVHRAEHPGESIEAAAAAVCEALHIAKPDADTFARYYKRDRIGGRLEAQYQLIKDFEAGKK
jgi:hypothetical protein